MSANPTTVERINDQELVISRVFSARPATVFAAWTRPELVRRWWAPAARGVSMSVCEADVRPGGAYRYVLVRPPDEQYAFSGEYLQVEAPQRLVYTQRFEPFPDPAEVTVTFEARGGATHVVARERYPSKEALDMAISSGMEEGLRETYEQLEALVAGLPSPV